MASTNWHDWHHEASEDLERQVKANPALRATLDDLQTAGVGDGRDPRGHGPGREREAREDVRRRTIARDDAAAAAILAVAAAWRRRQDRASGQLRTVAM